MARPLALCLPNSVPGVSRESIVGLAARAEQAGFDSLWTIDRLVYDNLEPLITLAAAAAVTQRVRLGTSIFLLPLRQPALLAKMVASLDVLSRGRVVLGVGVGSRESDFIAADTPYRGRGARTEEAIALIRRFWTEGAVTHEGRFYQVKELDIGPKPLQRPIPFWMGGRADRALDRVGRIADGYVGGGGGPRRFREAWPKVRAAAQRAGRDPDLLRNACLAYVCVDDHLARAEETMAAYFRRYYGSVIVEVGQDTAIGPPRACVEKLQEFYEAGVQIPILVPVRVDEPHLERVLEIRALLS
ncbi:MAG: LLM class flavin-dependent oxidoreductase [Deltaproteobacteria bacterium]|nr:LLM class flavin-dependent oxidoreductase [Deltaproteobacteria bacterium]MBI3079606.1 LLM class flavin-dependent oxidoreductase [Deltaproteobacteria bacterium]